MFIRGIDALRDSISSKLHSHFHSKFNMKTVSLGAVIDETKKHTWSRAIVVKPELMTRRTNVFQFVLASKERPSFKIEDMKLRVISSSEINVEVKSIMITQLGSRTNAELFFTPKEDDFKWEKFLEEDDSENNLIGMGSFNLNLVYDH